MAGLPRVCSWAGHHHTPIPGVVVGMIIKYAGDRRGGLRCGGAELPYRTQESADGELAGELELKRDRVRADGQLPNIPGRSVARLGLLVLRRDHQALAWERVDGDGVVPRADVRFRIPMRGRVV